MIMGADFSSIHEHFCVADAKPLTPQGKILFLISLALQMVLEIATAGMHPMESTSMSCASRSTVCFLWGTR